jgi:hypothetical protein
MHYAVYDALAMHAGARSCLSFSRSAVIVVMVGCRCTKPKMVTERERLYTSSCTVSVAL